MDKIKPAENNIQKNLAESVSLQGKRTLISGAASGIGRAICSRFAQAGSDLLLLDINEDGLNITKELLGDFDSEVQVFKVDLAKKEEVDHFWENIATSLPDILINNAGIYPFKDFLKVEESFYANTLEINLNSVFWMCQNFIRNREKLGGIIVNLSSIEAILPFKEDLVHYSISKAGVIALTRSLARDYGKKGFRVNCILPGAIKTPGTENLIKHAITKLQFNLIKTGYDFSSRLALGRWGNPDEVAKVILFLSSDLASYVQGVILPVDGGFLST